MDNKPFWRSSADPTQLSLTIQGLLTAVFPLALLVARKYGVTLSQDDLGVYMDAIEKTIIALTGAWLAFQVLYGLIRKAYYAIHPKPRY